MAAKHMSPADCLSQLPDPQLDFIGDAMGDTMRRIELRRSILAIAELDHPRETALVTAVVAKTKKHKRG